MSDVEPIDTETTPGDIPDPQLGGLGGQRPLAMGGIAPLPPDTPPPPQPVITPTTKKRAPITPPPLPPRLDIEEVRFLTFYNLHQFKKNGQGSFSGIQFEI